MSVTDYTCEHIYEVYFVVIYILSLCVLFSLYTSMGMGNVPKLCMSTRLQFL